METKIEAELATELQEMYLENKEWLSNVLFLEDEMRFFQQLYSPFVKEKNVDEIQAIGDSLTALQERRNDLKAVLNNRQVVLEAMLRDEVKTITLEFIEEDSAIVKEIKALLAIDKEVKKDLFALIEALQPKTKTQKYPIL